MRRTIRKNLLTKGSLLLFILLATTLFAAFSSAEEMLEIRVDVSFNQELSENMLPLINQFRTGDNAWYWNETDTDKIYISNGTALTWDAGLEKMAKKRAAELTVYYSHTRPNGLSCFSLALSGGAMGENIAYGYHSTESMFDGFKEESYSYSGQGHRRNMLNPQYKYVGVACAQVGNTKFWVEEFSSQPLDASAITELSVIEAKLSILEEENTRFLSPEETDAFDIVLGTQSPLPELEAESKRGYKLWILNAPWRTESYNIAISDGKMTGLSYGSASLYCALGNQQYFRDVYVICDHHDWDDGQMTKLPTRKEKGTFSYYCRKCGKPWHDTVQWGSGWKQVGKYWFYGTRNGVFLSSTWQKINKIWYYFNPDGSMATGFVHDGATYYMNQDGSMATGWVQDNGHWYYLDADGVMQTGWRKVKGDWYYFLSNGQMVTGWQIIDGLVYYFNPAGNMATGWVSRVLDIVAEDGTTVQQTYWYWLDSNGNPVIGWQFVDQEWKYFDANGILQIL